jgi:hypothetical protein
MKHRIVIFGTAAICSTLISACGGDGGARVATAPSVPNITTQSLDTAQVLAQARETSETSVPFPVNKGELVLTDTSDTTEPLTFTAT